MVMTDLRAGIYRHYKGPLYLLLGVAHDANMTRGRESSPGARNAMEPREVVVYVPLQLDGAHLGPRLAVRTRADFEATVCTVDGCPRYGHVLSRDQPDDRHELDQGHQGPRFRHLGEHLTAEMLP